MTMPFQLTPQSAANEDTCKNGHIYTLTNTRRNSRGWRECRMCDSARQKKRFDKVRRATMVKGLRAEQGE